MLARQLLDSLFAYICPVVPVKEDFLDLLVVDLARFAWLILRVEEWRILLHDFMKLTDLFLVKLMH